jgi:hypothetical protein
MKKCMAFCPIGGFRDAWMPCVRRAERSHLLCRWHADAVAGAMLGFCVNGYGEDEAAQAAKGGKSGERKGRANGAENPYRGS